MCKFLRSFPGSLIPRHLRTRKFPAHRHLLLRVFCLLNLSVGKLVAELFHSAVLRVKLRSGGGNLRNCGNGGANNELDFESSIGVESGVSKLLGHVVYSLCNEMTGCGGFQYWSTSRDGRWLAFAGVC